MLIKITNKEIIWSYLSQFCQFGTGFFLLPVILKILSAEELAIWYIFLAANTFANILDFGFQPTIMRNVSYIFSGINEISRFGINKNVKNEHIDFKLLFSLIKSCKTLYRIISLSITVIFIPLGTIYLISLNPNLDIPKLLIAWVIYVFSVSLNFYFYYYTPLLLGRGKIKESNITIVLSKITFVTLSYILVLKGYGLLGIAIGNVAASFVNRYLSFRYFHDAMVEPLSSIKNDKELNLLPVLWHNSYRQGIVTIGSFLILKTNTFLVTSFLGLEIAAQYGLTLQIFDLLTRFSMILIVTYVPLINQLRTDNDNEKIINIVSKGWIVSTIFFVFGFLFILFLSDYVLKLMGSNVVLLSGAVLPIIGLISFLEMNHTIAATIILTKNIVPFAKASIFSGISIVIVSSLLFGFSSFGIYSAILAQGIVQLLYNNWKWPLYVFNDLKTNPLAIIKNGFSQIKRGYV